MLYPKLATFAQRYLPRLAAHLTTIPWLRTKFLLMPRTLSTADDRQHRSQVTRAQVAAKSTTQSSRSPGQIEHITDNSGLLQEDALARLEVAQRLLADEGIRSVTIDREQQQARVQFCDVTEPDSIRRLDTLLEEWDQIDETQAAEVVCWPDDTRGVEGYFRAPRMATGWKRALHLSLAGLTFALAVIGVILPGIPTTPFLLLTSYHLLRSSHRLHNRLLDSKVFGPLLRDWHVHRGVRPGVKTKSLLILFAVVGATVYFSGMPARALWGITACSMIGVVCILRLRVIRD